MSPHGSGGRPPVWTGEQIEEAAELHQKGWSVQSIADELGLTRSTTRRLLVKAGTVRAASEQTTERRRLQLRRLARHLERGQSLPDAAGQAGVTVDVARLLIRDAQHLIPEGLPEGLRGLAEDLTARMEGTDVRAAAADLEIDPWWALLLLVLAGRQFMSMQPQRQADQLARIEQMAALRAGGASYEQIGREFGIGRQRVRALLVSAGEQALLASE